MGRRLFQAKTIFESGRAACFQTQHPKRAAIPPPLIILVQNRLKNARRVRRCAKQRHGRAELAVARPPHHGGGVIRVKRQQGATYLRQPRPEHRIGQIRSGLAQIADAVIRGQGAAAESLQLGKDIPHPVARLFPALYLRQRPGIAQKLHLLKMCQIVCHALLLPARSASAGWALPRPQVPINV